MYQKQTFQEMMQRYNHELAEMQKRAEEASRVPPRRPPEPPAGEAAEPRPPEFAPAPEKRPPAFRKSGCAAGDGPHSQTVGSRGPVLWQDGALHESLEQLVHNSPRKRPVHAKGWGALGSFTVYRSMREYTKADFLQEAGHCVPALARFSRLGGGEGSPDTARDIRGFSVKFYTKSGIFDLVGNHIPVFFVRDALRLPEALAALSPDPRTNLSDPARFWEFLSRAPEALHAALWLYSDFGTVGSYRFIRGYGVNTFVWRNAAGERRFVKYHWLPLGGERRLTRDEAIRLAGSEPDLAGQDLRDALERGEPAEYELNVQLLEPAAADALPFDPLDATKLWNAKEFPLLPVGRLTLDRSPEDYGGQVESAAFSPANLVEGIEFSSDKLLQGRSSIYWDSQRLRLGPGFRELPVNREPGWTPKKLVTGGNGERVCGEVVREGTPKPDDFTQAGQFYRALGARDREHLAGNIAAELSAVPPAVRDCVAGYLKAADVGLAVEVERRESEIANDE